MDEYISRICTSVKENGQAVLCNNQKKYKIHMINIVGEIEGHERLGSNSKVTRYEDILPMLAAVEDDSSIDGVLVLLNTVGGDVEAGLAMAEMIASLSVPKVCLVSGGGHSIGVPLAVSGDVTYIAPTATMIVHPIRITGTVLGVRQNYEYIEKMQDRIISFTARHSNITEDEMKRLMFNTSELTRDIGTMLVGADAVKYKLADALGGIKEAMFCLYDLINKRKKCIIENNGF